MSGRQNTCENCGASPLEPFVVRPTQTLWRCVVCDLYQKGQLPDEVTYEEDYHGDYGDRLGHKLITAAVRLSAIAQHVKVSRPRLLDIGCSVGAIVEAANMIGWCGEGVDVSQAAIDVCRARGLNCHKMNGFLLPYADQTFDVVTAWHVIEHVQDVAATLHEWYRVVKPGGVMVLETPDAGYFKARIRGASYQKFWAPEHTYTFRRKNLHPFLERAGFEIIPNPIFNDLSLLPLRLAAYSLAYRTFKGICRSLCMSKALEIHCRRSSNSDFLAKSSHAA